MSAKVYGGLDFGGTNIKGVACYADGSIIRQDFITTGALDGPDAVIKRLTRFGIELFENLDVLAAGVGVCGPVDRGEGRLLTSPVLPSEWAGFPIRDRLQDSLGVPIAVENDANCAILGEWWLGPGSSANVLAGLVLGTGIGGGLIIDGQIYRGSVGMAGEFGHIAIEESPPCPCGGSGCVEVLASATATMRRYFEAGGEDCPSVEALIARSLDGDKVAKATLDRTTHYLTRASRLLINVLNPDVFVLTGGMSGWGSVLAQTIQERIRGTTFKGLDETPIRIGSLGMYSGALGAVQTAVRQEPLVSPESHGRFGIN